MAVIYTTVHSSGLTKTRKSKDHKEPRYTHAVWAHKPGDRLEHFATLKCRSIASYATVQRESKRYPEGWIVEVTEVTAEVIE